LFEAGELAGWLLGHTHLHAHSRHADYILQVYIAASAVEAEQTFEQGLLADALTAARTPFLDYLPTLWSVTRAASRDAFDAQQMRNATCLCGAGATSVLVGTTGYVDEASWQNAPNCTGRALVGGGCW